MVTLHYYKRYRMEVDLGLLDPVPALPEGCVWVPWNEVWLDTHAEVKWNSFRGRTDTRIFPNLGTRNGCLSLMQAIRENSGFCPQATWLVAGLDGFLGTIQGICESDRVGAIQNLGVIPEARRHGLGQALLLKALHGFASVGLSRGALEVTARNGEAIRLYHHTGFIIRRTVYREAPAEADGESR